MKLNEVLIRNKVVKYDSSAPLGSRYVVVDESMNRVISKTYNKHVAKKYFVETEILKENTPPADPRDYINFSAGQTFQIDQNTFAVGMDSSTEVIEFRSDGRDVPRAQRRTAEQKAQAFLKDIPASDRSDPSKLKLAATNKGLTISNYSGFIGTINGRIARATATTYDALEKLPAIGPTLRKLFNSPVARGITRVIAVLPLSIVGFFYQQMQVINDLEIEAQERPEDSQELVELRNILVAQNTATMLVMCYQITKSTSLFNRALQRIKWTVRAVQGAAAGTGVLAVGSALSFLVTEASWLIAGWIITSPTVQRAVAEWIQQTWASVVFNLVGGALVASVGTLDTLLDGEFGTGELRDSLGFGRREARPEGDGEYTSTSEWAKLVFHGLLFPPDREQLLVPYIGPEQRATLLRQTMGIAEETTAPPAGDSAADVEADDAARVLPAQTSEPGMPVNPDASTGPQ